ncbi:unnamed protein product, partial [Prorocentrum cordatum]
MSRPVAENPEMSTEEALAGAVAARSAREDVRGLFPLQHALGRAPDLGGHFFEGDFDEMPCVEAQRVDKEYGENYARMCAAEQEYLRQDYARRISRAENAQNQARKSAAPGTWARFFREEKGETKGRFKGLARALASETARPMGGDLAQSEALRPGRPGTVVWLARAGQIIEVDLCQIRAAFAREIARARQGFEAGHQEPEHPHGKPVEKGGKREISERTATQDEVDRFNRAKATEEVMRMRWVLEWMVDVSTGDKKAKARIVVLGHMGPEYERRPTTAPTMTRTSRHLLLQMMARLGSKGHMADVTGAFTQNREIQHNLFVMPVKELATALGMPEGVAMRFRKAVRGLVAAAVERCATASEALEEFGWTQMKMGPCVWVLHGDARGQGDSFTKRFRMDQGEYSKTIEKASLTTERKRNKDAETADTEKGQLRAILGAVGWRSEQSGPMHPADASLLLSTIPSAEVQTINETNRLVDRARQCADLPVVIHSHSQAQVLVPIERSDSSESNRPDGRSTKGLIAGVAPLKILKGDVNDVGLVSWKSGKIDRGCRSSVACETRSPVDAEGELFGISIDWRNPEDALGLRDRLQTTVYTFRGKEERTDVDAMALKEGTQAANIWMPRVHGDVQLANSLTKGHQPGQLRMHFDSGYRWKLVYDAKYQSARKRKAAGILPFENVPQE